jgi:hypothetical protein
MSITPRTILRRTSAVLPDGTSGYQQRNFVLGVVSGIGYNLSTGLEKPRQKRIEEAV